MQYTSFPLNVQVWSFLMKDNLKGSSYAIHLWSDISIKYPGVITSSVDIALFFAWFENTYWISLPINEKIIFKSWPKINLAIFCKSIFSYGSWCSYVFIHPWLSNVQVWVVELLHYTIHNGIIKGLCLRNGTIYLALFMYLLGIFERISKTWT